MSDFAAPTCFDLPYLDSTLVQDASDYDDRTQYRQRNGWCQSNADVRGEDWGYLDVCKDQWLYAFATADDLWVYALSSYGCGWLYRCYLGGFTASPPVHMLRYGKGLNFEDHCFRHQERLIDDDISDTMEHIREIVASSKQYSSWNDDSSEPRFNYINDEGDCAVTNLGWR